jgi:pimeloyl-ACP methyl ester carboxylesterase
MFVADSTGAIDLTNAPSEDGTFTGVDPAGLFWSMRPDGGLDRSFQTQATHPKHMFGAPAIDPVQPYTVEITARGEGEAVTSQVRIRRVVGDIEVFNVSHGRVRGMAFRWRDRTKARGAIMTLTGSGGGVEVGYSPLLASLGYDVLGLAYFNHDDLPDMLANIPLEYFEEAFQWMRREFGCEKIAVQGASRGGELTLVLASYLPQYVNGCVAVVPMYATVSGWDHDTNQMGPSWTLDGSAIPYAPWEDEPMSMEALQRLGQGHPLGYAMAPLFRSALEKDETRDNCSIPVERANGPILCVSGVDDAMWDCSWGSDIVINRLRAHGFKHRFKHLALRETGHLTPLPNQVTTFSEALYHPLAHVFLTCGGNPQGAAQNSSLYWKEIREHYRHIFGA